MKLLIVTQKIDENEQLLGFFVEWVRKFAGHFDLVSVICLQTGEYTLPNNVKVYPLGKDSGASKLRQIITFYRLVWQLRDGYDVVLVHMNPIWMVLGGLPWRIMGKLTTLWYTHKAVTFKLRLAEISAQKIFTASKESFRLTSDKVIVTGHGIDTELFKPDTQPESQARQFRILSVGRIAPVKNYEALIQAAKILKDKKFDFHVDMVGEPALPLDKEYKEKLQQMIHGLGLDDSFSFVGKVVNADLPYCYCSHDLFIHLSRTGSVDKVLLEAMACGMRVLSSNDSARAFLPRELLFNDKDPAQLAEKVRLSSEHSADYSLRQYVVVSHNLDRLIDNISRHLMS